MDGIGLLSSDDLHTLSSAMSAQKEIALTRTKGDTVVTACVKPAPGWVAKPSCKGAMGWTWAVKACPQYTPDPPKARRCD